MKRLKSLLLATVLCLGTSYTINAQAKTAHVDVNELISKMPAMLDAQKQLEKLSGTYDAEYKTMAEEYQNKIKKYDQEASSARFGKTYYGLQRQCSKRITKERS